MIETKDENGQRIVVETPALSTWSSYLFRFADTLELWLYLEIWKHAPGDVRENVLLLLRHEMAARADELRERLDEDSNDG